MDWLCLPDLDSPSLFGALLDAEAGGRFELAPRVPHRTERRYVPDTNVLETTFFTGSGVVQVTDAMTLPAGGAVPMRELVRRVEGRSGAVPLRWRVDPRFGYGSRSPRLGMRCGVPVATSGGDAVAIPSWGAGEPRAADGGFTADLVLRRGERALVVLSSAHQEPLVVPGRREVEDRLEATTRRWRRWLAARRYDGPWEGAVRRSALALALLIHAPSGAVAAAATTSLPEELGGERNWDYRFCWVRDSAFVLRSLFTLGCTPEADAFFWWLMQASQLTRPRLQVLYRLDGGARAPERILPLAGYRGSRPVRVGNGALEQLQLDVYGDVLQTAWLYHRAGNRIDRDVGRRLAEMADLVCRIWRRPDAGIWEVRSQPRHFTHSKMLCWVALDRAARLADAGAIPRTGADRWRAEAHAIRRFVEGRCWSASKGSYVRSAGSQELDASVLLGLLFGFHGPRDARFRGTLAAVRRELATGPLVRRYAGPDGLRGREGAFLACSFWTVECLARSGRLDEGAEAMERLVAMANDVGLFSEEIDPASGTFLGNFPQALTHLSLISAAAAFREAER